MRHWILPAVLASAAWQCIAIASEPGPIAAPSPEIAIAVAKGDHVEIRRYLRDAAGLSLFQPAYGAAHVGRPPGGPMQSHVAVRPPVMEEALAVPASMLKAKRVNGQVLTQEELRAALTNKTPVILVLPSSADLDAASFGLFRDDALILSVVEQPALPIAAPVTLPPLPPLKPAAAP